MKRKVYIVKLYHGGEKDDITFKTSSLPIALKYCDTAEHSVIYDAETGAEVNPDPVV